MRRKVGMRVGATLEKTGSRNAPSCGAPRLTTVTSTGHHGALRTGSIRWQRFVSVEAAGRVRRFSARPVLHAPYALLAQIPTLKSKVPSRRGKFSVLHIRSSRRTAHGMCLLLCGRPGFQHLELTIEPMLGHAQRTFEETGQERHQAGLAAAA